MEIKKSKKANLENKKKSIFFFGLLTSLGFFLMAFEWAAFDVNYELPPEDLGDIVLYEPAVQAVKIKRPQPATKKHLEQKANENLVVKKIPDPVEDPKPFVKNTPPNPDPGNEIDPIDDSEFGEKEDGPKEIPTVFKIVEEMPSYVGGEEELFKYIGENLKYNRFARETGVQGRISVQFVVEKDGSITNIKVLNRLEEGLEKNAIKTISGMKKWNPGKQRGKNVRVQMVIPLRYKLK